MQLLQLMHRTKEALNEYVSLTDPDLEGSLKMMGDWAARIIPDCVGLSLTLFEPDVTFALVAPALECADEGARAGIDDATHQGARPDACQDAWSDDDQWPDSGAGGPARGDWSAEAAKLMDEDRWATMARSHRAVGVASTLSMPVLDNGRIVGGINVYASRPDAFSGHHQELATALGASAEGAVTNADLGFEARARAEEAPRKLREEQVLDVGIGILAARLGLPIEGARQRLHDSARHAGVTDLEAAVVMINALRG